MAFFRVIISNMSRALGKYPLVTNCAFLGTLHVAAEFTGQTMNNKIFRDRTVAEEPYDVPSMARYGIIGAFGISPTLYYWYNWLDGRFKGTAVKIVVKKVVMDQFLMTPIILAIFFVGMSAMEGLHISHWLDEYRQKFLVTYATSCGFWMPAQSINFTFIKPKYRVAYVAVCAFIWTNILCYYKRNN